MIDSRRYSGGISTCFRLLLPAVVVLFSGVFFSATWADNPPYKIEVRLTEDPTLQLLDNRGKVWQTLPLGSVRKRVTVQDVPLLASFGRDSQHHLIIMLALDSAVSEPVAFLFEKNIIVESPEASLTCQLSPNQSTAEISPSLSGKIWVNGALLPRGETSSLPLHAAKRSDSEIVPSPDQPKPSVKDFQAIPPPSI